MIVEFEKKIQPPKTPCVSLHSLLLYSVMKSDHSCRALVVTCIDFRFVSTVRDYLTNKGLRDNYDLITFPGASLNINSIEENIDLSFKLHSPSEIYIFDHEDCGAYGTDNSQKRHQQNLKAAKQTINSKRSTVEVKIFMATHKEIKEIK